jgi:hypothetical protein
MAKQYVPKPGDRFIAINRETEKEARIGVLECIAVHRNTAGCLQYIEGADKYLYANLDWRFKCIKRGYRKLRKAPHVHSKPRKRVKG